jgi:acyl-CoA synthetase (NDP forming)
VKALNICQNRAAFIVWFTAMAHWLKRMLSPETIAIVGASERSDSLASITYRQLLANGFRGTVYPVNPKYDSLHGLDCYASLAELPGPPDLVIYAISGLALEQSFDQALTLKVGGIVIYAANYIENDSQPSLPERLRQKARAAGVPVCGGNSMGFYNYDHKVMVSFDQPPANRPPGHIGMILHSGSGMTYLANNDARFCFNYVIASAQETNASVGDYMDYLLQQPSTRVIALLLETVRDVPAFIAALEKARDKSIPVVITRLGRTEKSAQLAMSHSGAIVGDHEAFVALCRRYGVVLCRDADEMIVSAMLFAAGFRVDGGGLASMLDSGGMREQMIDLAEDHGIRFAEISDATAAVLRAHLETGLDAVNPMDGMGSLGRNTGQTYLECGKALMDDPDSGLLSFEFEFRDGFSHYPELFEVTRQLADYSAKPLLLINSCSFTSISQTAAELTWLPVINGIDVALRALRNLMNYQHQSPADSDAGAFDFQPVAIADWSRRIAAATHLDELSSLEMMSSFGMPVVASRLVENPRQLRAAGDACGWPVVRRRRLRLAGGAQNRAAGNHSQVGAERRRHRARRSGAAARGLPGALREAGCARAGDADGGSGGRGIAGHEKRCPLRADGDRRLWRGAHRTARRTRLPPGACGPAAGGIDDRRTQARQAAGRGQGAAGGRSRGAGRSDRPFFRTGARVQGYDHRNRSQSDYRQSAWCNHRRRPGNRQTSGVGTNYLTGKSLNLSLASPHECETDNAPVRAGVTAGSRKTPAPDAAAMRRRARVGGAAAATGGLVWQFAEKARRRQVDSQTRGRGAGQWPARQQKHPYLRRRYRAYRQQ